MIKYALVCERAHEFESWFADSEAYDLQAERGLVECPFCGSSHVVKALMAPAVSTSRRRETSAVEALEAPCAAPTLADDKRQALRAMARALHAKLTADSTDVGDAFPNEARKMHDGEAPRRPIHGKATLEEARALVEDGVPVLPLPTPPDERN